MTVSAVRPKLPSAGTAETGRGMTLPIRKVDGMCRGGGRGSRQGGCTGRAGMRAGGQEVRQEEQGGTFYSKANMKMAVNKGSSQ